MKKQIKILLTLPAFSGLLLLGCNNNDTSSSTTSTDTGMTNKDTGMSNNSSTNNMNNGSDTSKMKSTTATGKKKGKVSTIMMTSPEKAGNMAADKEGYYSSVETLATYPGGQAALDQFINSNVTYPDDAMQNNKEGTVVVSFGVDENGMVTNPKVTSAPIGNGLEDEAVRVIKKMPAWTPGMVKGKKVKSRYSLPIRFTLA